MVSVLMFFCINVLNYAFGALTLLVACQAQHIACKNTILTVSMGDLGGFWVGLDVATPEFLEQSTTKWFAAAGAHQHSGIDLKLRSRQHLTHCKH